MKYIHKALIVAVLVLSVGQFLSVSQDIFVFMLIGLLATFSGSLFSIEKVSSKLTGAVGLVVAIVLVGILTTPRQTDTVIVFVWLPFSGAMVSPYLHQIGSHLFGVKKTNEKENNAES